MPAGGRMRVVGVDLSGSDAIVAMVEAVDGECIPLSVALAKIPLGDLWDTAAIRRAATAINRFLDQHNVKVVVIGKRSDKGRFSAGGASFRLGTLFVAATSAPRIHFVTGPRAKAAMAKTPNFEGYRAYQHRAFALAMVGAELEGSKPSPT